MKKIVVVLIVIVILVGVSVIALDQRLIVRNYEVASDLVNEPIRLVVISDLHSTVYGEGQEVLIEMIAAQEPDVILRGILWMIICLKSLRICLWRKWWRLRRLIM
jgi:predicted MPP superfamily phosphohydrolase